MTESISMTIMVGGRRHLAELLIWFLVLSLCQVICFGKHKQPHPCPPSSCGGINITAPFRLANGPTNCGDTRYNLFCENNHIVLLIGSGQYYVQAINYNNLTMRVVDVDIPKDNRSTIPHHSLSIFGLTYATMYGTGQIKKHKFNLFTDFKKLSEQIIFLTCENPVRDSLYWDTTTCFNGKELASPLHNSKRYSYVTFGSLKASEMKDSCSINRMAMTSWPQMKKKNISCVDVHQMMAYGFELSWGVDACSLYYSSPGMSHCRKISYQCSSTSSL